jgi:hypothetical protein
VVCMVVVADMQAYLVPDWVGGVPLQWFGPGDGRLAKGLYQKRRPGLEGRWQDAATPVGFGSDDPLG